jgi:hypothetical protein
MFWSLRYALFGLCIIYVGTFNCLSVIYNPKVIVHFFTLAKAHPTTSRTDDKPSFFSQDQASSTIDEDVRFSLLDKTLFACVIGLLIKEHTHEYIKNNRKGPLGSLLLSCTGFNSKKNPDEGAYLETTYDDLLNEVVIRLKNNDGEFLKYENPVLKKWVEKLQNEEFKQKGKKLTKAQKERISKQALQRFLDEIAEGGSSPYLSRGSSNSRTGRKLRL